jgi:hypothetical protein
MFNVFKSDKDKFILELYAKEVEGITKGLSIARDKALKGSPSPSQIFFMYQSAMIMYGSFSFEILNTHLNKALKNIENKTEQEDSDLLDDEFFCHYVNVAAEKLINKMQEQLTLFKDTTEKLKSLDYSRVHLKQEESK